MIDNKIYVIGGYDAKGSFVEEVSYFSLKTCTWNSIKLNNFEERSHFAACTVAVPTKNYTNTLYNVRIKSCGIYIFGGKTKTGITKSLAIITKRMKEVFYEKATASGTGPCARYNHSMNYCDSLNILVIYGGKSEGASKSTESTTILNDVHILSIDLMTWSKIETSPNVVIPRRALHSADIIGNELFIFGGINESLMGSSTAIIMKLTKGRRIIDQSDIEANNNNM